MKKLIYFLVLACMMIMAIFYIGDYQGAVAETTFEEFYSHMSYETESINDGLGMKILLYINDPEDHVITYETNSYEDEGIQILVFRNGNNDENLVYGCWVNKTVKDNFENKLYDVMSRIFEGEL